MKPLSTHIAEAQKAVMEYFRPEDFKCGGCLECEGCLHYFKEINDTIAFQLTKLAEGIRSVVPPEINQFNDDFESGHRTCRTQTITNIEEFLK